MNKFWVFILLVMCGFSTLQAQYCNESMLFTWEGDTIGNKAVWSVNDMTKIYQMGIVDVTVSLADPYLVNTTTTNPSEFNDYTKSNAFYGAGSLMLQATSTTSNQPLCLHFKFSSPVIINDFKIFDIDYLAGTRKESSFQDSISFQADMYGRNVPLKLENLSLMPRYTIFGQSVRSKFVPNTNGNLQHTDLRGGVKVHSDNVALSSFTLCYSNGSQDDGLSNSHAIRIMGFNVCSVGLGAIGGKVKEENTDNPLSGSTVQVFDTLGLPVFDTMGNPYIAITGPNGLYSFNDLPYGIYDIVQTIDPLGYHSISDSDGANDNVIRVIIDSNNPISMGNDFIEANTPLPVDFGGMLLSWENQRQVNIEWSTFAEVNNDYFSLSYSYDGNIFNPVEKIFSKGNSTSKYLYSFLHEPTTKHNVIYYKLSQTDLDGRYSELSIDNIRRHTKEAHFLLYPNPTHDLIKIVGDSYSEVIDFSIFDAAGFQHVSGTVDRDVISVRELKPGSYFLQIVTGGQTTILPFQKL